MNRRTRPPRSWSHRRAVQQPVSQASVERLNGQDQPADLARASALQLTSTKPCWRIPAGQVRDTARSRTGSRSRRKITRQASVRGQWHAAAQFVEKVQQEHNALVRLAGLADCGERYNMLAIGRWIEASGGAEVCD